MLLAAACVDNIRSASISEVIGHFVKLKKKGNSLTACCPFHNEKTSSFHVNAVKEMYKCFGCGASGDAIRFVMEHERVNFLEACEKIAELCGIPLEYEEPENKERYQQQKTAIEKQEAVLNYVIPIYRNLLNELPEDHPVKCYLKARGITEEVADKWQLGWAGTDWRFITPQLISHDMFDPAHKQGIIKTGKDDRHYDGYRSRLIFPIADRYGRYIGMGGRFILVDEADQDKKYPKYINPSDSEIYNKSSVLFGLDRAVKAIEVKRFAYMVEGYMDVISPGRVGIENVVAPCGTSFTSGQMKLLKRFTDHVAIWSDNDEAGKRAARKIIPELLAFDYKIDLVAYEGKDPDEYIQQLPAIEDDQPAPEPVRTNAITARCIELMDDVGDDMHRAATAKSEVLQLLACIKNEILRSNYLDLMIKKFKWKATETNKAMKAILDDREADQDQDDDIESGMKFFDWMDAEQKEHALQNGWIPVNRKVNGKPMVGYYSFSSGGKVDVTNFIVNPLFHVYAGVESRFMVEVYNGWRSAILDVPAKVITSIEQFQAYTVSEGNYLIFGAKTQWLRIASELLQRFKRCTELKWLGWQTFGFFAYVDKIFIPGKGLFDLDALGIIKHEEENYLIPASCEAYKQLQRTGDDPYENDRVMMFQKSSSNFKAWADLMQIVYKEKGPVAAAWVVLSLFRDVIFEVDNNCPHLYAFGEPSSGKSKWAESITAVFYTKRSAFNLNSGTDFAFFSYMKRFANCPAHLNEFEIEVIKPEWFQAIKGAYDGEGRERGIGGSKNKTEIMKIKSTLILTGQKLVTADDNSVVTRSIIEPFATRPDGFTDKERQGYDQLKQWEATGMSEMLTELLPYRPLFKEDYKKYFDAQLSEWRKGITDHSQLNQRILQNYAHLAACYKIAADKLELSMPAVKFSAYCFEKAEHWSKFIRSSDTLSEFWHTMSFLVDQQQVIDGWDYVIETVMSVTVRGNRKETFTHNFDQPTKVIYIRLNNIHKLFQAAYRSRTGKEAMNIENLTHYFSSRKYFIGPLKSKKFKRFVAQTKEQTTQGISGPMVHTETRKEAQETVSSCYAFVYDMLGIEIERNVPPEGENAGEQPEQKIPEDLPF